MKPLDLRCACALVGLLGCAAIAGGQTGKPGGEKAKVSFPFPLISEVLYAVPTGGEGDANGDGVRHATGDEFIEIVNPHDRPIEIGGFTLSDKRASERDKKGGMRSGAVRFTFPRCTLKPGQVAVVFNGCQANWEQVKGPDGKVVGLAYVGDQTTAPAGGHPAFDGALVFTMKITSDRTSLANTADWVLLSAPNGQPINLVKWGSVEGTVEGCELVDETPKVIQASVQRVGLMGQFESHPSDSDFRFSPGRFVNELQKSAVTSKPVVPMPRPAARPAGKPETKPTAKPESRPESRPESKPESKPQAEPPSEPSEDADPATPEPEAPTKPGKK
jgi:hypothetical protein